MSEMASNIAFPKWLTIAWWAYGAGCTLIISALLVMAGIGDGWFVRFYPVPNAASIIAADIGQHPDHWRGDQYTITNGIICIWVANGWKSLGIRQGADCKPDDGDMSESARYTIYRAADLHVIPRLQNERLERMAHQIKLSPNSEGK